MTYYEIEHELKAFHLKPFIFYTLQTESTTAEVLSNIQLHNEPPPSLQRGKTKKKTHLTFVNTLIGMLLTH